MTPSIAGSVLTWVVHVVMIVMLALPSDFLNKVIMLAMGITLFVCAGLVAFVQEDYKRKVVDLGSDLQDANRSDCPKNSADSFMWQSNCTPQLPQWYLVFLF